MNNIGDREWHPLTVEVKSHFTAHRDNEFVKKLSELVQIESVDVSYDNFEDNNVLIRFTQGANAVTELLFINAGAEFVLNFGNESIWIPFYYSKTTKEAWEKHKLNSPLETIYLNYEERGKDELFKDILELIENFNNDKVFIEYISGKKPKRNPLTESLIFNSIKKMDVDESDKQKAKAVAEEFFKRLAFENSVLKKARIIIKPDNKVIAASKKWKDKLLKSKKLMSIGRTDVFKFN